MMADEEWNDRELRIKEGKRSALSIDLRAGLQVLGPHVRV